MLCSFDISTEASAPAVLSLLLVNVCGLFARLFFVCLAARLYNYTLYIHCVSRGVLPSSIV